MPDAVDMLADDIAISGHDQTMARRPFGHRSHLTI